MLNFTVGPVQTYEEILQVGGQPLPYFRTPEFSEIMMENETLMNKFMRTEKGSRTIFLTGSGTAAMEASVIGAFDKTDRVLIINGGGFGQRFVEICKIHQIPFTEINLKAGKTLTYKELYSYDGNLYTGMLVNMHETSTGVLYNMEIIGRYCKENNICLVVDAISSFIADELQMDKWGIEMVITSSQKALALPPGISMITMTPKMAERIRQVSTKTLYFDLKDYLENGARGQTPYTPAVGILLQLNKRLKMIDAMGIEKERESIKCVAENFRERLENLPLKIFSNKLSNAVTPLVTKNNISAYHVFLTLKDEYQIFVCPNGGLLADKIFRVGHIGALSISDNDVLLDAFRDMNRRNLL